MSNGQQGGRSLDAAKIEAAYIGFHLLFQNRLAKANGIHKRISTVLHTDNLIDRQIWLQNAPKMRRWIGDKHLNKFRAESHPIVTQPHEASVEVPKHDILNDRFGLYADRIGGMADAFDWALDELAITMLCAGMQGTALGATYDGQNLFDTDHTALSVGGTSQSNYVTGALSATTYGSAWQKYLSIQDENAIPQNVAGRQMVLVVGPANRVLGRQIILQNFQAGGAQNMDSGTADLIVTPWISSRVVSVLGVSVTITGNEWFLMPADSAAILLQIKREAEFLSVEDGEFAFRTGKYLYGIEAEFGAAYGLWQEAIGGNGS